MEDGVGDFGTCRTVGDYSEESVAHSRSRNPWLWALGGVLVASALWAVAVFRWELGVPEPDTRGYRLTAGTCRSVQLTALTAEIGPKDSSGVVVSGMSRHPAADHLQCFIHLRPDANGEHADTGWFIDYTVGIDVALHKQSDPGVEFEAGRRVTDLGIVPESGAQRLPDLGDQAYLITRDSSTRELRVLDGGVVLSLSLSAMVSYQGVDDSGSMAEAPEVPDLSAYRTAMIDDLRDLKSRLKK
ncbi:hypothetical protein DN051_36130 [Streptomyces cadmiisoli]|uniref:Uncharacterized protein n=1 Tax=Streptomyces cadmiisoli TaxID=2184053 RepID=A0A2Z4J893_9ACTN|nr:hypothetical protein DN051_36130 [Streptomyces cadmiisoli]